MNRKDIIIADSTASRKLALWDVLVNQIQLEKSYLFKNVATRSYFNEKYITTTPATSFIWQFAHLVKISSLSAVTLFLQH
jgi:hypothetical protein